MTQWVKFNQWVKSCGLDRSKQDTPVWDLCVLESWSGSLGFTWMQVSLCQCESTAYSCEFVGCGLCGRKEVGHGCGLWISSVHASPASSCGPAETWTGLARTKCFHLPQGHVHCSLAGGGRLTCQESGLGLSGLWERSRTYSQAHQEKKRAGTLSALSTTHNLVQKNSPI